MSIVVLGVGNRWRRDDGVGPAVADRVAALDLPGVRALSSSAEPTEILDVWAGAALAVIVDAVVGGTPGTVRRRRLAALGAPAAVSSHDLSLRQTYELARALGRAPASVEVITVDVADTGQGEGLSPAVRAALPEAVRAVRDLIGSQRQETGDQ